MQGRRLHARKEPIVAATPPTGDSLRYDAFISYSHAVDGALAPALQRGLHRFAKPWYRLRLLRIFRDQASLSANPGLWSSIESGLTGSRFFILLASPEAAGSPWVSREVEYWCTHKPPSNLLIVLTEGEIVWDGARGDFDWDRTDALPPTLRGVFPEEPLYVDFRWGHAAHHVSLNDGRFRDAVADLATPLHGGSKDELIGEDVRQHRRTLRLARTAATLLTVLTLVSVAAAGFAVNQRDQARRERDVAVSRQLAADATALLDGDPGRGLQLALQAFDRRATREAEMALRRAISRPGARVRVLAGHNGVVHSTQFSPDGRRVVSAGADGTVRVWDLVGAGEPIILHGHQGHVKAANFSPDGSRVVSAGADGTVRIWEFAASDEPLVLHGHRDVVNSAVFSLDGKRVVSASDDHTVRVWDLATGREPLVLQLEAYVNDAAFSPDGRSVASAGDEGVRIWDLEAGGEPARLEGHRNNVSSVAYSEDGGHLVTAGDDVRVWDLSAGTEPVGLGVQGFVWTAGFSPDRTKVVSAGDESTVRVWDLSGGADPTILPGHEGRIRSASFNRDGRLVVSGGDDGTVRVWDLLAGEPSLFRRQDDYFASAAFAAEGRRVVTTGGDERVRLWDLVGGGEPTVLGGQSDSNSADFSRDGRRVVSTGADGVRLWDLTGGTESVLLQSEPSSSAAFSPDGKRVVAAANKEVWLWDLATRGEPKVPSHEGQGYVYDVDFSPDGGKVLSAAGDGDVRVWNLETGGAPTVLAGHLGRVYSAVFSPDGRRVASAGDDGIRVWDLSAPHDPMVLRGHRGLVKSISFNSDGTVIASGGADGTVRVWDGLTGRERTLLEGHRFTRDQCGHQLSRSASELERRGDHAGLELHSMPPTARGARSGSGSARPMIHLTRSGMWNRS